MAFHVPNNYRIKSGALGSDNSIGNNGAFWIPAAKNKLKHMKVIASDGEGWEHVSVSWHDHAPNWDDMCYIKKLFWDRSDAVIQIHPPENQYVNNHPFCLHLWRLAGTNDFFAAPPWRLVGVCDE